MTRYTENISITIFLVLMIFSSYEPVKVYRTDMDDPVFEDSMFINNTYKLSYRMTKFGKKFAVFKPI